MLDPKMVSRDCLHLLAVAFDGLRAVTSRRVEGTATSLIATTDCLRLLVIAFDRSCAIVCAICDGESSVTSLCAMASRHVEDTTTGLAAGLVATPCRHFLEGRSFVEESVFLTRELAVARLPQTSRIWGIWQRRLETVLR